MIAPKTSQNRPDEMPPPLHAVTDPPTRPNYPAHGPHNGLPEARHDRPNGAQAETSTAQQQEDTIPLKPLYRVSEAVVLLSLSRTVVYELIRSGRLRTVTEGRTRLVPATAITEYLTLLEHEAAPGHLKAVS